MLKQIVSVMSSVKYMCLLCATCTQDRVQPIEIFCISADTDNLQIISADYRQFADNLQI